MAFKTYDGKQVDLCEYCCEEFFDKCNEYIIDRWYYFDNIRAMNSFVFIEDGKLKLFTCICDEEDPSPKSVKINYCPMCGRKLEKGEDDETT